MILQRCIRQPQFASALHSLPSRVRVDVSRSFCNATVTNPSTNKPKNDFVIVDSTNTNNASGGQEQDNNSREKTDQEFVEDLTPAETVAALDRFVIGQKEAKKAVAISLRNRWRRQKLTGALKKEVLPTNILMIGPTGTGKTEIARRLSALVKAPFVKVEATKYTEVGFHGTNTDECIKDLVNAAHKMEMKDRKKGMKLQARDAAENEILCAMNISRPNLSNIRAKLRAGELDEVMVTVQVPTAPQGTPIGTINLGGDSGQMAGVMGELKNMMGSISGQSNERKEKLRTTVKLALPKLQSAWEEKLVDKEELAKAAIKRAEQSGIVFVDEIDKLTSSSRSGGDSNFQAKGEGVQKELLALVEGCSVRTEYGHVNTDHILFIGSGAFHKSKPSDLLPELQGRMPIKVKLEPLTADDFERILTETDFNLIEQHEALLGTENVSLHFDQTGIKEIASLSAELNRSVEDIGARRLRAVISKVVEDISFDASSRSGHSEKINAQYVRDKLKNAMEKTDLSKYIW
eukprot:655403_1